MSDKPPPAANQLDTERTRLTLKVMPGRVCVWFETPVAVDYLTPAQARRLAEMLTAGADLVDRLDGRDIPA